MCDLVVFVCEYRVCQCFARIYNILARRRRAALVYLPGLSMNFTLFVKGTLSNNLQYSFLKTGSFTKCIIKIQYRTCPAQCLGSVPHSVWAVSRGTWRPARAPHSVWAVSRSLFRFSRQWTRSRFQFSSRVVPGSPQGVPGRAVKQIKYRFLSSATRPRVKGRRVLPGSPG